MKIQKNTTLALLAVILAVPALFNGIGVLTGFRKFDIVIIEWLVWYNIVFAIVSLLTAYEIWNNNSIAGKLAGVVFSAHTAVLGILLVILFTTGNVAMKSITIMVVRVVAWFYILFLVKK